MAYKLLAALCKPHPSVVSGTNPNARGEEGGGRCDAFDPSQNLRLLLDKGLTPLRQRLYKPDVWGYR